VSISGGKAETVRLPDYLMDAPFNDLWDPNPMFDPPLPATKTPSRAR
jgi:hypothetical protein